MVGIGNKLYIRMIMKTAVPILAGYAGFVCLYHISMGHPDTQHSTQTHATAALLGLPRGLGILKYL